MQIQDTEYIRSNNVVICHVYVTWNGDHHRYTGVSICHPDDKFDFALGKTIAWQRAFGSLLSKVQRWTAGVVANRDHNAAIVHKPLAQWAKESKIPVIQITGQPDTDRRVPRYTEVAGV